MQITPDIWINPAFVASMVIDSRNYANVAAVSTLVITMADGTEHRIRHEPHYLGGADIYDILRRVDSAQSKLEQGC